MPQYRFRCLLGHEFDRANVPVAERDNPQNCIECARQGALIDCEITSPAKRIFSPDICFRLIKGGQLESRLLPHNAAHTIPKRRNRTVFGAGSKLPQTGGVA